MSKPTKPSEPVDADIAAMTFEQAAAEAEAISDRIESGEIGLEDTLAQYERSMKLIAHCRRILERSEQRISELTPDESNSARDAEDGA